MLDWEHVALECALLSAQACGIASVEDYRQYQRPEKEPCQQDAETSGSHLQHSTTQDHNGKSAGGHDDGHRDNQILSHQVREV